MSDIVIRDAVPADVPKILELVKELATFEREPEAVIATEADFLRDGWGPSPRFFCRMAELDGRVCGFALWFFNYSTWRGHAGLYIEDLYVSPWARGHGIGARLVKDLARIAVAEGASRLDLSVLEWNPAREFYHRLGLVHRADWLPYRIEGEALLRLGSDDNA
jgi:GNAT superfamily N-acetyltransferase